MSDQSKYDKVCSFVRKVTKAEAVFLIIINGDKGSGFAAQAPFLISVGAPAMLRRMANDIEEQIAKGLDT